MGGASNTLLQRYGRLARGTLSAVEVAAGSVCAVAVLRYVNSNTHLTWSFYIGPMSICYARRLAVVCHARLLSSLLVVDSSQLLVN